MKKAEANLERSIGWKVWVYLWGGGVLVLEADVVGAERPAGVAGIPMVTER